MSLALRIATLITLLVANLLMGSLAAKWYIDAWQVEKYQHRQWMAEAEKEAVQRDFQRLVKRCTRP